MSIHSQKFSHKAFGFPFCLGAGREEHANQRP